MISTNDYNPERHKFALARRHLQRPYPPIGSHCSIGPGVTIGAGTVIRNNVTITGNVTIGKGCLIHSGAVIGERGFSFGFDENLTPEPIVHNGGVIIGNFVEIGTCCAVAGGTLKPTVLEDYVKIDNITHIAHNSLIGEKTVICSRVVLCGGVTMGRSVWVSPGVSILNRVKLADRTLVGIGSNVLKDTEPGDIVAGNPAKVISKRSV